MMFTNDTTKQETIQQTVSDLFTVRAEYYRLIGELEQQTGLTIKDDSDIGTEIDYNHAGKVYATPEDVAALIAYIKKNH